MSMIKIDHFYKLIFRLLNLNSLGCDKSKICTDIEPKTQSDKLKALKNTQSQSKEHKLFPNARLFQPHIYGSNSYDEHAKKSWIVQKFIPSASVGILVGASQAFKTFIAVFLAQCITNQHNFGSFKTQHGLVFIAVGEGVSGITMRIKALEDYYGSVDMRIVIFPEPYNLQNQDEAAHIAKIMREESIKQGLPARMLILDTLSQNAAGIQENDAAQMSSYLRSCADFARDNSVTVLNVHHEGKNGIMRGSSTLLCNVDFVLNAKRESANNYKTILSIDKMKDGSTEPKMTFLLEKYDLGFQDCFGEDITTLVVSNVSEVEITSALSKEATWLKNKIDELETDVEIRVNSFQSEFMHNFNMNKAAANTCLSRTVDVLEQSGAIKTAKKGKFRYITRC